ncbi:hypothetical protein AWB91_19465 [Mycobacterium paraense]|uniref:DUF5073 domain-containing protein n=1 Tax=Mycobacterium paraense TaxID=767916 RepID=A0ABX3VLF4_9MYCO|nr:DUF5073 family protein [Mycobacterium paraense]MCV7442770.1 DUF5073 family protein [Mycobacterium paraense]ORW30467.1 hypothetical protein AWB91_19465 [Mycobacterium paraense]ORW38751.1 hypothetical protein AWB88_19645 [Mycobacterium paraense]ORW46222.1 hypothetical protein AWB89_14720 [Mycobacterium paraense]
MTAYDHDRVSHAIGSALAGPGGVALVVKVFCGVPGVVLVPARRGFFRSQPERIQIGDWRYEVTADGRLSAAHVVNGIVLAEEVLPAGAVGPHVARALGQLVRSYGPTIVPNIDAALEVLESAPRF